MCLPIDALQRSHTLPLPARVLTAAALLTTAVPLQALQELNASDNDITDLPEELAQMQSLKSLWLYGNRLSQLPVALARMPSLQSSPRQRLLHQS